MKCPKCGLKTTIYDSRLKKSNMVTRRRECLNGHRFTTYEVDEIKYKSMLHKLSVLGEAYDQKVNDTKELFYILWRLIHLPMNTDLPVSRLRSQIKMFSKQTQEKIKNCFPDLGESN